MGMFKSIKLYSDMAAYVDTVATDFINSMQCDGYEVDSVRQPSGVWEISIKKGNLLQAVVGLQTAMKVIITPNNPHAYVKMGVGIFGQQAIPSLLTIFVFHPLLILQVWGLIKQHKLDKIVAEKITKGFCNASGSTVVPIIVE